MKEEQISEELAKKMIESLVDFYRQPVLLNAANHNNHHKSDEELMEYWKTKGIVKRTAEELKNQFTLYYLQKCDIPGMVNSDRMKKLFELGLAAINKLKEKLAND